MNMTNMKAINGTYGSLNSSQKEALTLLSMGTLLEYFDLFLYIHMAFLFEELFFPKFEPHNKSLLSAMLFCSTFVMRPISALLFGYIGDKVGRKFTIIITTTLMSISCIIIATLPTYAQIGITATYIIIACRVLQGVVSMVEVIGADLYVTEITTPPIQYPAVMLMAISGTAGGVIALATASYVINFGLEWRVAFWAGALVASVGIIARLRLRETVEFVDAKRRVKAAILKINHDPRELNSNPIWNEKVNKKTALALFFLDCGWPICFYFGYIYCPSVLKNVFNLTAEQIIYHNLLVSIIQLFGWVFIAYLSYKINPLKLVKTRLILFIFFILLCPYFFNKATSSIHIMFIQTIIVTFGLMGMPANPIFYKYFPVFKRFSYTTFIYALSRPAVYIITSLIMIYFSNKLNYWVIVIITMPIAISFFNALCYFEKMEKHGGQNMGYFHLSKPKEVSFG